MRKTFGSKASQFAVLGGILASAPAAAFEFEVSDNWAGFWDNTVTAGTLMRLRDRDSALVGRSHTAEGGKGFSHNGDNGNLNYDKGELAFATLRWTTEFGMKNDWLGFYVKGFYQFDPVNDAREELPDEVERRLAHYGDVLDAYIDMNFELTDEAHANIRYGRQVMNWGQSRFFINTINSINPLDIQTLRTPGTNIRDAQIPVDLFKVGFEFSANFSMEAFYQLDWEQTEAPMSGTYFSTNDFGTRGGTHAMTGFGSQEFNPNPGTYSSGPFAQGSAASRAEDRYADNDGQGGLALRLNLPETDVELGLYFMKYHSRLPLLSGYQAVNTAQPYTAQYVVEYPEDIEMFGVSFATNMGGWAVAGEYSYRRNVPLQLDDVELLYAGVGLGRNTGIQPGAQLDSPAGPGGCANGLVVPGPPGVGVYDSSRDPDCYIQGYRRHDVGMATVNFLKVFGPADAIGSDANTLLFEFGYQHVPTLEHPDTLRYEAPGTTTGGGPSEEDGPGLGGPAGNPRTQRGFATEDSWGLRAVAKLDYFNAIGSWTLSPRFILFWDVDGISPGPGANFIEGRKTFGTGIELKSVSGLSFDIFYAEYFGGGERNRISDRDYISISGKYTF